MSDWIRDNKYTVLFIILLFIVGFFSIIKPYIDKSDKAILDNTKQEMNAMKEEVSMAMDTLISIELEQLKELEKLNK